MKIALAVSLGFLFGAMAVYFAMRLSTPWALAASGSGSRAGVSILGLFESKDECQIFEKLYLERRKSVSTQLDKSAEVIEKQGIVATTKGRWDTALCTPLRSVKGSPGPSLDLSGVEDALSEIAANINR